MAWPHPSFLRTQKAEMARQRPLVRRRFRDPKRNTGTAVRLVFGTPVLTRSGLPVKALGRRPETHGLESRKR